MKFSDILALAKQGYKPSDIKELISLTEDTQTSGTEEPAETAPKEVTQPEPAKVIDTPAPTAIGESDKIKELEAQLAQVRKDLEKAQKNNTKHDNSGEPPPDRQQVLNDIVRGFM